MEPRTIPARRGAPPPVIRLRPYQAEVARAVLDSVLNRRGLTFTVEMARQAGKNELSAYLQMVLLLRNAARGGAIVKAAPTFQPQALISIQRILQRLGENGLNSISRLDKGHILHVGRCRATYLSAHPTSNVVGQTADLLLEIDEAQDVSADKFNRDFRPMAAAQNATTVLYGTAWRSDSLLEQVKSTERLTSTQRPYDSAVPIRHFRYDWQDVARHNPPYGSFVEAERQRLGEQHPLFRTQYALLSIDENTRLFNRGQIVQLHGDHPRQEIPRPGAVYVAGLDLAGAPVAISEPEWGASGTVARDETVLTIGEVIAADDGGEPQVRVVQHFHWRGTPHGALTEQLTDLLKNVWRVRRVAVDATGIGEPTAAALHRRMGQTVQPIVFTQQSKSRLGFGLLALVNAGRLRLYADDQSTESTAVRHQLRHAQAKHNANRTMNFYVPEREGHDDYLVSLALLAHASTQEGGVRKAVGRSHSSN
ncbi:MAG: hypothetical protein OXC55_02800 [Chloroflexi bacterium]|nr:hypothetical protein [Chloroflexota bacterium]